MLTGILYMYMKLVVLDGYTENPGDLDWRGMEALGDLTVYALSLIHIYFRILILPEEKI